jgi:hypothetical protein
VLGSLVKRRNYGELALRSAIGDVRRGEQPRDRQDGRAGLPGYPP